LVAVALLTALGPVATARAIPHSDLVLTGPVAGAGLTWNDLEVTVSVDLVVSSHFNQPDFGTAGRTVMGPFAAADGKSSGMVFRWTATARDPVYLFSVDSLFPHGVNSWTPPDEVLWARPNLGVVPGGNLSVFETGAVDVISWNFLEFSCALLALRVEDYVRLKKVLEPGEFDLNSRIPEIGQQLRAVPDPETSLLMGQGLLFLALIARISHRAP
jgi:hypothetical protein